MSDSIARPDIGTLVLGGIFGLAFGIFLWGFASIHHDIGARRGASSACLSVGQRPAIVEMEWTCKPAEVVTR